MIDRTGVAYNPLTDSWRRSADMDVNYMLVAEKRPPEPVAAGLNVSRDRRHGAPAKAHTLPSR